MAKFVLAKVCRKRGISKRQLAKRMNKPYWSVFRYFRPGFNPTLKTIGEISDGIGCSVKELVED